MQFLRSLLKASPQLAKSYALPKRNMSVIAVPPRERVSKAELIFLSTIMVIGWTAIPAWVLVNIKHYRSSGDE